MNKSAVGKEREEEARAYLRSRGVRILDVNYRIRTGEIDVIGLDEEDLVFFEVKYRKSAEKGMAAEAVDVHKQYRICRVSDHYVLVHDVSPERQIRYDVVAMDGEEITWIKNAFDYLPKRSK